MNFESVFLSSYFFCQNGKIWDHISRLMTNKIYSKWLMWHGKNKSKGVNVPRRNRHTTLTPHQPSSWYLFLLLCHDNSKKVKALASLQRFLQKNPFNGKILPGAVLIIYFYFCAMNIQKSKGLGFPSTSFAKKILSMAEYYQKLS